MRRRKFIVVTLVGVAALLAALAWRPRCPVALRFMRLEAADIFDTDGTEMGLLEVRVQNRDGAPIEFRDGVHCAAKVANRWVEVPDLWTLRKMAGGSIYHKKPPSTGDVMLLVPADATACRFRLKYRYLGQRPLALGIGDPWARIEAPSVVSLRVQQATALVCPPLYNWLWPASAPTPGRWRKTP